ncbi:MAG: hypothetical protein R6W31_05385 [Bacteroidales bacterium]
MYLDKILASSGFVKSRRYSELLQYLVKKQIEGAPVKEVSIAIDVFGKDASFNSAEDTIVRVSIGILRKKLAYYYLTQGIGDILRIEIPPGNYEVQFNAVKPRKARFWNSINVSVLGVLSLVLVISLSALIMLFMRNREFAEQFHPVDPDNPLWYEYIHSDIPNMILLGDYFFMIEMLEGENRGIYLRDSRINSMEEYEARRPGFKRDWLPLDFTYLRESVAMMIFDILPILRMGDQPVKAKQSSELLWEDFDQANIIFAGTIKSLNKLEKILPNFNIRVERDSVYQLQRLDEEGNVAETYSLPRSDLNDMMTDYAFVGKIRGANGNTIMIIASGDDVGLTNAVQTISSADFGTYLQESHPEISFNTPFYFEMFLRTQGVRKTDFSHEIVYFKKRSE